MANNVQLGVSVVDNTKQGLSSAFNNTTKMTAKMAKQLVLEVNVAFPNIASKTKDLQSQLSKAFRSMGNIDFVGERLGKKGNGLGLLGFNGKKLREDMSLDAVKQHLDRLKTIQSKLKDNTLVSGNKGDDFKKEQKHIANAIRSLEMYKNTLELIFRTNAKFNTQLTTNASRLNNQAKSAKRAANETARAYQQSYAAIDRARNRFSRGGNSSKELADMRRYYQQQQRAARENEKIVNSFTKQGSLLGRLSGLASRYFSIYSVINFGRKVAETTGYFKQQQVALEGILGSASKAREVLNDITNFALKSPFQTKELVGFTKQLSAFGIKGDDLFPTVTKLADISAGLGVDMSRIILAYGQVKSASVLRGQELRQFTEAGVPMVEKLAKKFEALNGRVVTTAEVFELISKRQVPFEMVASVLSDMTAEGGEFYKMQENITNTLYGQIEKLKDMWTIGMRDIGNSSISVLNGIIKLAQALLKNAKSVAIAIGAAFAVGSITKFALHFDGIIRKTRILVNSTKFLKASMAGLAGVGIGVLVGVFSKLHENAVKLGKALADVDKSFSKDTEKMVSGLDSLTKKLNAANIGTKEYNDAIETLAQNYGDFISSDVIQALKGQGDAAHQTAMEFAKIAENVKEAIRSYNEYSAIKEKQKVAKEIILDDSVSAFKFKMFRQGDMYTDETKKDFQNYYGRTGSTRDIRSEIVRIYENASREFIENGVFTKSAFEDIFEKSVKDIFPHISEEEYKHILADAWNAVYVKGSSGQVRFNPITDLNAQEQNSDYYGLNKHFEAIDPSKTVYYNGEDKIDYANNLEAAYIEAAHNTLKDKFGKELPQELSNMLGSSYMPWANRTAATDNFDNNTISEVNIALKEFANSLKDADAKKFVEKVIENFQKGTEIKTGRAAIVSDLMENNDAYRNSEFGSVKSLWSTYVPSDNTYEQKRDQIKKDYDEKVSERDSYVSKGGKDKARIDELNAEIEALKKLASVEYYNVDLSSKKGGGSPEQIAPELTEFLNSLKNGYSRYKEAAQKGGTAIGLGYARTDEQFQEMFGQFFGGADSEAFKGIAGLKIGDKTVGNLLQDKFLSGMEEGVLDFESAVDAVASELESYGTEEGQEEYRKAYVNAAKQMKQWSESTFSKDNLSAALQEFDQQLKKLTSTFEMTNKAVDAYRKLSAQGTQEKLGSKLGISELEAIRPQSSRQQDFIKSYVATYNAQLGKFGGTEMFNLDASSISDPIAINAAINKIDELFRMQDGNFSTTELGQSGAALKSELQKLADIMIQEMAGISAKPVTGSAMENAIAGAAMSMKSTMFDFSTKQAVAGKYGMIDTAAIESLIKSSQDQAQSVFDAFMKSEKGAMAADLLSGGIDKEAFFQKFDEEIAKLDEAVGGMPETLKFELEQKKQDLGNSIDKFNTEGGKLGLGDQIRKYRGADEKYQKEYDSLVRQKDQIAVDQSIRNIESYQLKRKINDGTATEEEVAKYHQLQTEIAASDALLAQLNARLDEIGENGGIAAQKDKLAALNEALDKVGDFKDKFSQMQNAVIAVVDSLKACVDTFAKFYDIANDGENPEWLTDIQEGMGNFIENFKTAVAPILAVVGAIIAVIVVVSTLTAACTALNIAATPLLIIMAVLIAVAAIVAGIMTAIQAHDNNLEHSIEDLKKQVEEFEDAAERLNSVAERMTGIEKLKTQVDALGQSLSSASAYAEMARLEEEKKDTDEEKVKEYEKQAFEASEEFNNGIKGMLDELIGATEDWSSTMSNSIRSAFQNGDNAARSFRASIKEMMGDIVQSMLEMAILQPLIEDALQEWTNSDALKQKYTKNVTTTDENGNQVTVQEFDSDGYTEELLSNINDPEKAENAYNSMQNAGDAYIDAVENLPDFLNDAFKFNSDTSSLSGGISGITEDTARQLEGLANSMLMQQIIGNSHLASMSSHLIATIQISWFNGMLEQAKATRIAAENLDRAISDMRNGIRPMSVTMV